MVPELKEVFPEAPYFARPGQINAWDNDDFVKAMEDIPALADGALKEAHFSFYAVSKYLDQGGCERLMKDMLPVGQASC